MEWLEMAAVFAAGTLWLALGEIRSQRQAAEFWRQRAVRWCEVAGQPKEGGG